MDIKELIARRVAAELKEDSLVNLGIGLPSTVANYLPAGLAVYFQAENGLIGMSPLPEAGMEDPYLTDAGGSFIGALPGACAFDSSFSFGLIRGGHLDVTVLGGLQVDEEGMLANWTVPGAMVPGMGGAMDLVTGAKKVIVAMTHTAKGAPKILKKCTLPLTSIRRVDLCRHRACRDRANIRGPRSQRARPGSLRGEDRRGDRGEAHHPGGRPGNGFCGLKRNAYRPQVMAALDAAIQARMQRLCSGVSSPAITRVRSNATWPKLGFHRFAPMASFRSGAMQRVVLPRRDDADL